MHHETTDQEIPVGDREKRREEISLHNHPRASEENAEGTRKIPLTQGKFAIVDEEDFEGLVKFQWHCDHGYAARSNKRREGVRHTTWMHRVVNNTPDGLQTDHINGDKLDNRRVNLRAATPSENLRNRRIQKNNTSGFKGACWHKASKTWHAKIKLHRRTISLGYHSTAELAHAAYCEAAKVHHGAFSSTQQNQSLNSKREDSCNHGTF